MKKSEVTATGRRKRSVAQVKLVTGKGKITVNGRDVNEYMPFPTLVMDLKQPLVLTNNENTFDIDVKVNGGGFSGQAGAIRLAITKALVEFDAEADQAREDAYKKVLREAGFLTRDPRVKERKKYGLKKARRAPQFSKR
ncbi:MAG: 30S ribosomal protein S9 [Bacilli bacterium]|jgi:small subunit ribosomal protein S9|nr:30S ribosomal protein S9 [Bacilli bacterium]PWL44407.1 MAG: 30S ribosomal protein S9 [Clostridiaceae bacterium]CDA53112.1 30S ribosomal protein S9 [Clostridium sp. CAG:533]